MGEVGGYSLHLYCDCDGQGAAYGTQGHNNNIGDYTGQTKGECVRRAKNAGWTQSKGKWLSPQCHAEGRKVRAE